MLGDIAAVFHTQPSELDAMDFEDLEFWHAQAERISKQWPTYPSK